MNPIQVLKAVQDSYRTYVHTFQKLKNPAIRDWVQQRVQEGTILWKPPYIHLSRRFEPGRPLTDLVDGELLDRGVLKVFTAEAGERSAEVRSNPLEAGKPVPHGTCI